MAEAVSRNREWLPFQPCERDMAVPTDHISEPCLLGHLWHCVLGCSPGHFHFKRKSPSHGSHPKWLSLCLLLLKIANEMELEKNFVPTGMSSYPALNIAAKFTVISGPWFVSCFGKKI